MMFFVSTTSPCSLNSWDSFLLIRAIAYFLHIYMYLQKQQKNG